MNNFFKPAVKKIAKKHNYHFWAVNIQVIGADIYETRKPKVTSNFKGNTRSSDVSSLQLEWFLHSKFKKNVLDML